MQLIIHGLASGSQLILPLKDVDLEKNLMDYLKENKLPIASSCRGEGLCKMCVINEETLSCQMTVRGFVQAHGLDIRISYL